MDADRVSAFVRDELDRARVPGAQIAAVQDGEIVYSAVFDTGAGASDLAITSNTLFPAMSITKTVIGTALMQLRDRGLFTLDDPANEYLDGAIKNEWEADASVTIRQLLTHTSGLPEDTGAPPAEPGTPLAVHVRNVAKTTRRPGEAIVYANWGFDALGVLIDRLSGMSFDRYVADEVFAPLGMTRSFPGKPPSGERHTPGHYLSSLDEDLHPVEWWDWPVVPTSPAGGMNSTATDLAKFLVAHLSGAVPGLKSSTVAEMHNVHASEGPPDSGQGLAFRVTRANGRRLICHGGDGTGHCAILAAHPDDGVGVVLLLNLGRAMTARATIANSVLRMLLDEDRPHTRVNDPAITAAEGRYRTLFWNIAADVEPGPKVSLQSGVVITGPPQTSTLAARENGRVEAEGGAFDGFELTVTPDAEPPCFSGGLYPFVFLREGPLPGPEQPLDETADLSGTWSGTAESPIGPLMVRLTITPDGGTVFTPLGGEVALEDLTADAGRVSGRFALSTPMTGDMTLFPRLEARGDRLIGNLYGRGWFGEIAMKTDLARV